MQFSVCVKPPKFLENTLTMFELAQCSCFLTRGDFDKFVEMVRKQLETDKPVGSKFIVQVEMWEEGGAGIWIRNTAKVDQLTAFATFYETKNIYRLSEVNGTWCNVYARVED